MRLAVKALVALAIAVPASAAPSKLLTVQKYGGKVVPDSYIVRLKPGTDKDALLDSDPALRESVTHPDWNESFFHGFAGTFDAELLNKLRVSDSVESIAEDGIVTIQGTQTDAPWGLSRLSSSAKVTGSVSATNYTYRYPDHGGQCADIYIVDTGIMLDHPDFTDRVYWAWAAPGIGVTDDNGHGTHVAGIAAGTRWGVAKRAVLMSVKVLNSAGSGTLANVVAGFNFVKTSVAMTGRPSIVSASIGGAANTAIDDAVSALVAAGIPVVVAAGNSNSDASNTSPARVPTAITVGSVDINDAKSSSSSYGSVVDIWAPGVSVISAYNNGGTATLSGTSMATPHVSGLVALYLCSFEPHPSPASISSGLWSTIGVISGLPAGTVNRLALVPA